MKASGTVDAIGKIVTWIIVVLLVLGTAGGAAYLAMKKSGVSFYAETAGEKIFGGTVTEEERLALSKPRESGSKEEEFYAVATRLMRETALNAAINKSILSSIYNFIYDTLNPHSKEAKDLYSGRMSDTPEYLERFEAEGIRNLRR